MARAVNSDRPHKSTAPHGLRRLVSVRRINDAGLAETISATPKELITIAHYLHLPEVKGLTADVVMARWRGKGVRVTGALKADVVQTCVVTLDPLDAHIEAEFERRFLPDEKSESEGETNDVFVDPDAEDPPEPLTHEIDLGEILVEELSLNLDPYPRKAGVAFEGESAAEPARANPFAVLAKLKPKSKDKT